MTRSAHTVMSTAMNSSAAKRSPERRAARGSGSRCCSTGA
jgi:hypothetical protein